jgi:hypothetical protein
MREERNVANAALLADTKLAERSQFPRRDVAKDPHPGKIIADPDSSRSEMNMK